MPEVNTTLMPFAYNQEQLAQELATLIAAQAGADGWQWLREKAAAVNDAGGNALQVAFAAIPRKIGKQAVKLSDQQAADLDKLYPGFTLRNWTLDRLSRVWLLLQLDPSDRAGYLRRIEQLFPSAEMNELAALYSALPLLAYPDAWKGRCAEGIRSNIGLVLEAVICNNPYPAAHLGEGAWNQLVMKAFFTEKRVDQIIGFDQRANPELTQILIDFAHERWAAGRTVPPLLWRGVAPYLNEHNFADLERAFYSEQSLDRDAAALACTQSSYAPAKALLEKQPETKAAIENGQLSWETLAAKAAG